MSRAALDGIDDAILALLAERDAVVAALWADKLAHGVPLRDVAREAELFARVRSNAQERGLDPDAVESVYRTFVGRRLRRSRSGPDD